MFPQVVGLGAAAELAANGLEERARSIGELRRLFRARSLSSDS